MSQQDWQKLLERQDDLIGGWLETQESGMTFRGPIESLTLNSGQMEIVTTWTAVELKDGWHKYDSPFGQGVSVSTEHSSLSIAEDGRVRFSIYMIGSAVIYPKGDEAGFIDPSDVQGLDVPSTTVESVIR